jgi:hypothetical protein
MSTATNLIFGDVKVAYDKTNLRKTLQDFLKDAKVDDLKKIADHRKIKAAPFDRKLLMPVLIGEVQNEWYRQVHGQVPGQPEKNQTDRLKRYLANLEMIEKSDGTDVSLAMSRVAKGKSAEPRKANVYRLTEPTNDIWSKYKGQKRLIIRAMKELDAFPGGKGCTVKQISDTVRGTEETEAPSEKNCAFHLNAFGHEGVVEKQLEDGKFGPAHEDKGKKEGTTTAPPAAAKNDGKDGGKGKQPEQGKGKKK